MLNRKDTITIKDIVTDRKLRHLDPEHEADKEILDELTEGTNYQKLQSTIKRDNEFRKTIIEEHKKLFFDQKLPLDYKREGYRTLDELNERLTKLVHENFVLKHLIIEVLESKLTVLASHYNTLLEEYCGMEAELVNRAVEEIMNIAGVKETKHVAGSRLQLIK